MCSSLEGEGELDITRIIWMYEGKHNSHDHLLISSRLFLSSNGQTAITKLFRFQQFRFCNKNVIFVLRGVPQYCTFPQLPKNYSRYSSKCLKSSESRSPFPYEPFPLWSAMEISQVLCGRPYSCHIVSFTKIIQKFRPVEFNKIRPRV